MTFHAPTPKQMNFIALLADRKMEDAGTYVENLNDLIAARKLNRRGASDIIEGLMAAPDLQRAPVAAEPAEPLPADAVDLSAIPAGRYAVEVEGVVRFYRVDKPAEGKWAGWTFVKVQASDELHRLGSQKPGAAYRGKSEDAMRDLVRDPEAASKRYGREIGRCGICGRTLTDPDSIAAGIGPICAGNAGW